MKKIYSRPVSVVIKPVQDSLMKITSPSVDKSQYAQEGDQAKRFFTLGDEQLDTVRTIHYSPWDD